MAQATQDLVIRMKTDSKNFNDGIDKAKGKIKDFKREGEGAGTQIAASFGKIAGIVAAAVGAFKTFEGVIRSTEQGVDALDGAMYSLKSATNSFLQSLSTGTLANFTTELGDVVKMAREAYDAIDALGTMQMWGKARINQLNSMISEQRVISMSKNSTQAEKDEANRLIGMYVEQMKDITAGIMGQAQTATKAKLREMAGVGEEWISDAELEGLVWAFEHGELKGMADELYNSYATETHAKGWTMGGGGMAKMPTSYDITNVTWSAQDVEHRWRAMNNLLTKDEKIWQQYYDLIDQESTQRSAMAATQLKANKTTERENGGSGGSGGRAVGVGGGMTLEQQIEYLHKGIQNEILNDDRIKDSLVIEIEIQDEEIEEPETEELEKRVAAERKAWQDRINNMNVYASALGNVTNMFYNLASIATDDSPWKKFMNILGGVTSNIMGLIQTYTSLVAVESVARAIESGEGIPFPYNLIAIAAAGAAITGIIASIVSQAKSQKFAQGGIVGGNDYHDGIHANLSTGEMVLNKNQQARLWNMIISGGDNNEKKEITFKIQGSDLVSVIDNYNKIISY